MALMDGKTALVTGASRGIGLATCKALAREGANLVAFDLVDSDWSELKCAADAHGRDLHVIEGDVAQTATWERLQNVPALAETGLDALFNNAGVSGEPAALWDYPEETFDHVMQVNVRGVFLGMKSCVPFMKKRGGAIINMSSVSGIGGGTRLLAYNASKHAVVGMTKVAACELAQFGIRTNAICPAMTDTQMMQNLEVGKSAEEAQAIRSHFSAMIPLGRYADASEIAEVVCFLASPGASFINGAIIPVDGGLKAG